MNPAFDPFDPMAARVPERPGTTGGTGVSDQILAGSGAGGSGVPEAQQQHLAQSPAPQGGSPAVGNMDRPTPFGMPSWWHQPAPTAPTGPTASNQAAMAAWDPAAHPGRRAPTMPGWTNPNHQGAIGFDWSRYNQGGNLGNSNPALAKYSDPAWTPPGEQESFSGRGVTYNDWRAQMAQENPWMSDTNVVWGGGSQGYLPIDYQAQNYNYYQNAQNLAPWEQRYMQDTWTQNFDPNSPSGGYINTRNT